MAHLPGTELHYIIEGTGTLATGGRIVRPAGGGTVSIDGGVARQVAKGDVILIPENTPHWYKDVEGSITYLEVRFNVPVK
jgi:mannose-6-phosphate isomerase-like protein (cupin superfamily)